jgi:hypothetical protein
MRVCAIRCDPSLKPQETGLVEGAELPTKLKSGRLAKRGELLGELSAIEPVGQGILMRRSPEPPAKDSRFQPR